ACEDPAAAEGGGRRERGPADVEVATATEGSLHARYSLLGEARALARASLAAGASGEVRDVRVREGDRVRRGDLLVGVDPNLARSTLRSAEATRARTLEELAQAEREAARLSAAGNQAVAAVEVERARSLRESLMAQQASAEAAIAGARETLSRHRIVAPFDGVVATRHVDPGDWVTAGSPAVELVGDRSVEVLVRATPEIGLLVSEGHPATLVRGGERVDARVAGVVRAIDPATRTVQLRVEPSDVPAWLVPGTVLDVELELEREGEGVLVPRDALVVGVVESRVVTVVEGQAKPVRVEVLDRGTTHVRVRGEGLAAGAVVAVRGNDRLFPDQPVRVVEPASASASEPASSSSMSAASSMANGAR
ncbi:MAG: efflux RND transporter periplasmic adaptor subunit, partial [Myxococcales bacterium]|nr:efflux RND transporter periplasmic adaptor subunit [Myxococcales bacterium]